MLATCLTRDAEFRFGHADPGTPPPELQAHAPLPSPTGELVQDPDFTLTTTAGPLPWRLFYYSFRANEDGPFGYGRRASWPLRLSAGVAPGGGTVVRVEREDGQTVEYTDASGSFVAKTPHIFDTLVQNPGGDWVETRLDTGNQYHYPAGDFASLAYFETPFGQRVTFQYDGLKRLASIVDPDNRHIYYYYNGEDRVIRVEDWASRSHIFGYDAAGNLTSVQGPTNCLTQYDYDGSHRLISILDPEGYETTYTYDTRNRVTSRSVAGNAGVYQYFVNVVEQGVDYFDPYGKRWRSWLDPQGNIIRDQDPVGAVRTYTYNAKGQPLTSQNALGDTTTCEYNAQGRLTSRQDAEGHRETWTYDAFGNKTSYQNALGHIWTYDYGTTDAERKKRRVLSEQDPLGKFTAYTYNYWGALAGVQTPENRVTEYVWNNQGEKIEEIDPAGRPTFYTYYPSGMLESERTPIDASGSLEAIWTYTYDAADRRLTEMNPLGKVWTTTYDDVGNITSLINPEGDTTTFKYNAVGQETERRDPRGNRWTTVYDAKWRTVAYQPPGGGTLTNTYDDADRLIQQKDHYGRITTIHYDKARQPIAVQPPTGLRYTTDYDKVGREIGYVDPDGTVVGTAWDAAGQLSAEIETTGHRTTYEYWETGLLKSVTEPTGGITTYEYDGDGWMTKVRDPLNNVTSFSYDDRGPINRIIDASGRRYTTLYDEYRPLPIAEQLPEVQTTTYFVSKEYDEAGQLIRVVDEFEITTELAYDGAGRATAYGLVIGSYTYAVADTFASGVVEHTADYLGNATTYEYDPAGLRTAEVLATGARWSATYAPDGAPTSTAGPDNWRLDFSYDAFGRLEATADALGNRNTYTFDAFGRPAAEIDTRLQRVTIGYDGFGRPTTLIDERGQQWLTLYDAYGREIGAQDPLGNQDKLELDLLHRPKNSIDPLDRRYTWDYDAVGRVKEEKDPLGKTTRYGYRPDGFLATVTDEAQKVVTYTSDIYGRVSKVQDQRGFVTTYFYDAAYNRLTAVQNARGYITTNHYDTQNRLAAVEDAAGNRTSTVYDSYSRVSATLDAFGYRTTNYYDGMSRVRTQIDAEGHSEAWVYDDAGRLQATVDGLNHRYTTIYDGDGLVIATQDPLGKRTSYGYDGAGNRVTVMDARGKVTTYQYDAAGRRTVQIDPLGRRWTWSYDAAGQIVSVIDARNQVTTFGYTERGEEKSRQYADGTQVLRTYTARGELETVVEPLGTWEYEYDPGGNLLKERGPNYPGGAFVTYAYDEVGNLTLIGLPGFGRIDYGYDSRDNLHTAHDPTVAGVTGARTTWTWDERGQLKRQENANGTVTTWGYDKAGRTKLVRHVNGAGTLLDFAAYTYDAADRPETKDTASGLYTYAYDDANQLIGETVPGGGATAWTYDAVGNRTTQQTPTALTTYEYDAADQLTTATTGADITTYSYDDNGNRTKRQAPTGTTTYTWDAANRLTEVNTGTSIVASTYRYDGLRHQRTEGGSSRHMLWHSRDVLAVLDGGAVDQCFVRGPELARAFVKNGASYKTRYYHNDDLGTVEKLTTQTGTVEAGYVIDAWGNRVSSTGSAANNPYTYLAQPGYWDELGVGLYYVRGRWYDPAVGAWVAVDPVEHEARYGYARNYPTSLIDPSGLSPRGRDTRPWWQRGWEAVGNFLYHHAGGKVAEDLLKAGLKVVVGVVVKVVALNEAAYGEFYNQMPEPLKNFPLIPKPGRDTPAQIGRFLEEFVLGAFEGAWNEVKSTLGGAAIDFLNELAGIWEHLKKFGLDLKKFWENFVVGPFQQTINALMSGQFLQPRVLGSTVGGIFTSIILGVLMAVVTGGIAGALAGTRLMKIINDIRKSAQTAKRLAAGKLGSALADKAAAIRARLAASGARAKASLRRKPNPPRKQSRSVHSVAGKAGELAGHRTGARRRVWRGHPIFKRTRRLGDAPHFERQRGNTCAPTSIKMAARYRGLEVKDNPFDLTPEEWGEIAKKGTSFKKEMEMMRKIGFYPEWRAPKTKKDIRAVLGLGKPVLLDFSVNKLKPGRDPRPSKHPGRHVVLIEGVKSKKPGMPWTVVISDPAGARFEVDFDEFVRSLQNHDAQFFVMHN